MKYRHISGITWYYICDRCKYAFKRSYAGTPHISASGKIVPDFAMMIHEPGMSATACPRCRGYSLDVVTQEKYLAWEKQREDKKLVFAYICDKCGFLFLDEYPGRRIISSLNSSVFPDLGPEDKGDAQLLTPDCHRCFSARVRTITYSEYARNVHSSDRNDSLPTLKLFILRLSSLFENPKTRRDKKNKQPAKSLPPDADSDLPSFLLDIWRST